MTSKNLPVRTRETLAPDGSRRRSLSVFCPRHDRSVDQSACEKCLHAVSVAPTMVVCSPPVETARAVDDIPAGAASSVSFMCARSEVPAKAIFAALPAGPPWPLPIVNTQDVFLGFVAPWQGHLAGLPPRLARAVPASELLFGRALALPESKSVRRAVQAMALRQARMIALLDEAGALQGVLTDIDALHAIALAAAANRRR